LTDGCTTTQTNAQNPHFSGFLEIRGGFPRISPHTTQRKNADLEGFWASFCSEVRIKHAGARA
jgi:hypothetical protein